MNIDRYKYNQSLLKISRLQIKDLHDKIAILEDDAYQHRIDKRILYVIIAILTVGYIMLLISG